MMLMPAMMMMMMMMMAMMMAMMIMVMMMMMMMMMMGGKGPWDCSLTTLCTWLARREDATRSCGSLPKSLSTRG